MNSQLCISIITPCLNQACFVKESIESVKWQDYPYVEHIIVDGGSTDGTLDILLQYPQLRVTSELDRGLYDAINKGIAAADGDIIGVLNSDDVYEENVFSTVANVFQADLSIDAIVGRATLFSGRAANKERIALTPKINPDSFLYQATMGHPIFNACFFRKKLFKQLGLFNDRYKYAADHDFLIRIILSDVEYACLDLIVYHYRQHSGSLTITGNETGLSEYNFEDCEIAELNLRRKDISPSARNFFRLWHSQITADMSLSALRKMRVRNALLYGLRGLKKNLFWPLVFIIKTAKGTIQLILHGEIITHL